MELEIGDLVMCTVEKVVGTVVFVKIDNDREGSIVTSEIAPGRIRNLRDYVVPKKRIVCKILRISSSGNIELSLRRVTQKEKKEVIERDKQEKSYISILRGILKDKAEKIISKIEEKEKIYDFIEQAKENQKEFEQIAEKKDVDKIIEALKSQKNKKIILKKEISLSTTEKNGIELIKNILGNIKNSDVKYISAGRYSIKTEAKDAKTADSSLKATLSNIEKQAKEKKLSFSVK